MISQIPKYPKIEWYGRDTPNKACIAFEKYDGTNLSWHWNRELGFQKFYTRRREFDADDSDFGSSVSLFLDLAPKLEHAFTDVLFDGTSDFVIYTEYFGPNSFGGFHQAQDSMQLKLLDVWTDSLGFVDPKTFLTVFQALPLPQIVYQGKLTGKFVDDLKNGKYPVFEGVVCKGLTPDPKTSRLWSCKIKTQKWLERLQKSFIQPTWTSPDQIERSIDEELQS